MTLQLLPDDFEASVQEAIKLFWASRHHGSAIQGGKRGKVVNGKNLDGFLTIVRRIADHCGLPASAVHTNGRHQLTLPGYYRPTKNWDALIIDEHRLLAALEFKSQVGSFGNNFNNRSEEALGSAADFWMAAQHGAYLCTKETASSDLPESRDPRPPFLGYLMLLESCTKSETPVKISSPHYDVLPQFSNSSYASRYQTLCERLMEQNQYNAAALVLSPQNELGFAGHYQSCSNATSVHNLFAQLAGQLLAAMHTR